MGESRFAELKEKEKEARKQIVVDSASALFSRKPFYEVGMRDVADEAGISPATIYRYFPSQEDLFHETFLQKISEAVKGFKALVQKDEPGTIEEFAVAFVEFTVENEPAFQMLAYLMLKDNLDVPVAGKFDSLTKVFFDLFQQLLMRHGVDSTMARRYSRSFIASLTGILVTFRNYPAKNSKAVKAFILEVVKDTSALYTAQLVRNP